MVKKFHGISPGLLHSAHCTPLEPRPIFNPPSITSLSVNQYQIECVMDFFSDSQSVETEAGGILPACLDLHQWNWHEHGPQGVSRLFTGKFCCIQNNEKGICLLFIPLCHIKREAKHFKAVLLKVVFSCMWYFWKFPTDFTSSWRGQLQTHKKGCKLYRSFQLTQSDKKLTWVSIVCLKKCYKNYPSEPSPP